MLSIPHLVIIFVVALVVFGPEKLPELARTIGKVMTEFRRHSGDLRSTFEAQLRELEREADRRKAAAPAAPANSGVSAVANSALPAAAGQPAETAGSAGAPGTVTANPPYTAAVATPSSPVAEAPPASGSNGGSEIAYGVYPDPHTAAASLGSALDTSAPAADAPAPSDTLPPGVASQHSET